MITKLSKTSHTHVSEVSPQHAWCLISKSIMNQSSIIILVQKMTTLTTEKLQPIQILFVLDQKLQSKNPFSWFNTTFVVVSPCHQNNKFPPERITHERTVTNESI